MVDRSQLFKPWMGEEEYAALREPLETGWIGSGPKVLEFERQFAEYIGVKHAVALNSGTAALPAGSAPALFAGWLRKSTGADWRWCHPRVIVLDEPSASIGIRKIMSLSLTFDHRIVAGAPAARGTTTSHHLYEDCVRVLLFSCYCCLLVLVLSLIHI